MTVEAERIRIRFRMNPFSILEILNRATGETICSGGSQTVILRMPLELFEPTILTDLTRWSQRGEELTFQLADRSRKHRAVVSVGPSDQGIRFRMTVEAPQPVWLSEWRLSGLDVRNVIVPALGGQSLSSAMPEGAVLSYKYPFWWNAQFVLGETAKGGCAISSRDASPDLKLLRVRRREGKFDLTYGFEAPAPLKNRSLTAEWTVDCHAGGWKIPVDNHRRWMEEAFRLRRLWMNPFSPAWASRINTVLEMWGITKEQPEPLHTFPQMMRRLRDWKRLHPPDRTLVYLPGFAEHGIDSHAPDYNPSRDLGGDAGLRKLVAAAHGMGYRVMLHTNVLAMTFRHRLYPKFRKHQVVDAFGRTQGWGLDMDGDWLAEPYFAYMNPGATEWGDLMVKVIGRLVRKFGVDAIFLDQTLLAFNVSRGPNFVRGMRTHVERLQRAFPNVLFAGEGLHEQIVGAVPMAQIHGIDSVAEIHGMEGAMPWRSAHPVSTYLFGPYTRFVAHLLTKHPTHPMFARQEEAYANLGVVPALCLYDSHQAMDLPSVRAMLRRAGAIPDAGGPV